jgi:hypothetical protein
MKPTIGVTVLYKLGSYDAAAINSRRDDASAFRRSINGPIEPGEHGRTGHVEHTGNTVTGGDVYPALVVRMFGSTSVNLHVLLDGNDTYWATSRMQGDEPCQWSWPEKPEREPGDRPERF